MTVKNPKCLVIDASIARAAGGVNAIYPIPIQCRDFLEEIRSLRHTIIMTDALKDEWNKHQSKFARRWYVNMLSKRLVDYRKETIKDTSLRQKIFAVLADDVVEAVRKDMRLIEAAIIADERIASNDNKMRNHFKNAAKSVKILQAIVWINPTVEYEEAIVWLRQSAPKDDHRMLGYEDTT